MLKYQTHIDKGSMYNTPPVIPIFAASEKDSPFFWQSPFIGGTNRTNIRKDIFIEFEIIDIT